MLAPADTFGSSLKTALGQINAIDKITSKENVAHAIRSVALPRQSAGPILELVSPLAHSIHLAAHLGHYTWPRESIWQLSQECIQPNQ
jgi:hypothetical protein